MYPLCIRVCVWVLNAIQNYKPVYVRFTIIYVEVGICRSVLVFRAVKAIYVYLLPDTVQMHVYTDHS